VPSVANAANSRLYLPVDYERACVSCTIVRNRLRREPKEQPNVLIYIKKNYIIIFQPRSLKPYTYPQYLQTITQVDHDFLHPKSYVNDVIIDFWMLWLSRNTLRNESCEYFFAPQFYTKLIKGKGGLSHVSGWVTCRKDFNIFEKSIIYFLIVLEKHWSLFVAFSPAKVLEPE